MLISNRFDGVGRDGTVYKGTNYRDHIVNYLIVGNVDLPYSSPFRPVPLQVRMVVATAGDVGSVARIARELVQEGAVKNMEVVGATRRGKAYVAQKLEEGCTDPVFFDRH
ncbi:hypothetical protein BcepSauron_072 [Burkholderia phage BcepSauron]|uniref:Uncharacterized protein n=2 Tax=Sarumanvirus TaxID=2843450 RepID=A0A482MMG8_9CAUD|nr:hypothetical protein H1O16_gp072 [Burkholderia phage BcepSaruman]YP_009904450.1 hypothetical protein H1O17_gp072 [Burkholderia phage BcepSauron]QBQ74452.1 hypothetical protein BcepSauron_072 [Burkholderia phage BcepSauron]QBX06485.1 hypothetical protein BcepSaruman_072 [Burkholderia phage BcepSaruman]